MWQRLKRLDQVMKGILLLATSKMMEEWKGTNQREEPFQRLVDRDWFETVAAEAADPPRD